MNSAWTRIGALLAFAGVALGAFGAHGLKERLGGEGSATWETAVLYHLVHALALVLVSTRPDAQSAARAWNVARVAFFIGVLAFSGSLYALALDGPRWLGPITPLGGVAFLVGWVALALGARSSSA